MPVCGFREYIFLKTRIAQEGVSADTVTQNLLLF